MKYVVITLLLVLSGCATQHNQQQAPTVKEIPKVQEVQEVQEVQKQVVLTKTEAPRDESAKKPPQPKIEKPIANTDKPTPPITFENLKGNYSCILEYAYKVSTASSVKTNGGILRMTINEQDAVIQSSGAAVTLKLHSKSGRGITATNDTTVFTYNRNSHGFTLDTGIGRSGFNLAGGGHTGNQMKMFGSCSKQG